MKLDITNEVINDLWPLYRAGEASSDTNSLVDAFLAENAEFRTILEESERIKKGMPDMTLSEDAEMQFISLARKRLKAQVWLIAAAIGMFGFVLLSFLAGALFYALRG